MKKKKMNKKGAWDIRIFLLLILLTSTMVVTMSQFLSNMIMNYAPISDAEDDTSFVRTYQQLDQISAEVSEIETTLDGSDLGTEDSSIEFYGGALSSLKLTYRELGTSKTMIEDMSKRLWIPDIWKNTFITAIGVALITTVLFMIFKHTGE